MRRFLVGAAVLSALLIIAGTLDHIHRAADSIAIGRPALALICLFGVFAARMLWLRLFLGTTALYALYTVAVFLLPQDSGGDLRVYSKNLWYRNMQFASVAADIEASDVDVVMLQEVSTQNSAILGLLSASFPHQHLCRFSGRMGIAVLSRHPFDGDPICSDRRAILAVPLQLERERVWAVSAHIPWPWPHDSRRAEQAVAEVLSALEGPVVIAGDFNMVPWAGRVEKIAAMTRTQVAGSVRPSLYVKHVPLPIDLVLAPGGGATVLRPGLGSDHAGVVAYVSLW